MLVRRTWSVPTFLLDARYLVYAQMGSGYNIIDSPMNASLDRSKTFDGINTRPMQEQHSMQTNFRDNIMEYFFALQLQGQLGRCSARKAASLLTLDVCIMHIFQH